MSILIKGMEMPKNCFDCMFHWHGDGTTYCLAQSKMHDLHHIKWQCKGYEEQMKYREPTCPLVPVPPHCRLIDADALKARVQKLQEWLWDKLTDAHVGIVTEDDIRYRIAEESEEFIDDAPTIIESEGE